MIHHLCVQVEPAAGVDKPSSARVRKAANLLSSLGVKIVVQRQSTLDIIADDAQAREVLGVDLVNNDESADFTLNPAPALKGLLSKARQSQQVSASRSHY